MLDCLWFLDLVQGNVWDGMGWDGVRKHRSRYGVLL